MNIHHDTSLMSILEDDTIPSSSKAYIRFCLGKGARLWLVVRPSIRLICITHSIFTSTLRFCFSLIQPLASSLFTCECGHGLDAFGTHLACYPFGSQWIATHDAI